jgi:membrane-associated phospholipid phosphatase
MVSGTQSDDARPARRPRREFDPRVLVAIVLLLLIAFLIAQYPQREWEYRIIRALNVFAHRSALFDRAMHALTAHDLLQGVPLVALIWFLWFAGEDAVTRAKLLVGTLAAALAGLVSRVMQLVLPTHPRPLHLTAIDFVPPIGVEPEALNHFNSFPSDHAAVFFALAAVIWRARPGLGVAAFLWAAAINLARIYEGFHFPSDLLGSIGVAALVLFVAREAHGWRPVTRLMAVEQTWRPWFYMTAFVASYLIATLFDDIRQIGRGLAAVLLHHDVFGGS